MKKNGPPDSFGVLNDIVERDQTWPIMTARYGVENPLPPWKTSLDGVCDALDQGCSAKQPLTFKERRDEEDELSASHYKNLPYPENQLIALAHSLLKRGVISETELRERLALIRKRLES
jgi:Nitrile hydratase beta subunit